MNTRISNAAVVLLRSVSLLLSTLAILVPRTAMAALSSPSLPTPFVAALSGVWEAGGNTIVVPETLQSSSTGSVSAEAGSLPAAYAEFRSAFGSNGFKVQVGSNVNREAWGGSVWSDGFTVTSGTGSGVLNLSTRVIGSVSGLSEMEFALFASSHPYDLASVLSATSANTLGFWALSLPNSVRLMFTGVTNGCGASNWSKECGHVPLENYQGPVDLTLSASVPFISGQPVYVLSVFSGGVGNDGGSASFLNSADFGVTAPVSTTLQSLSSTVYAAAVPEPPLALLFAVGLALVGSLQVRRASQR